MVSTRVPSSVVFALLIAFLLPLFGCSEDYRAVRHESEETRAIRDKVRADMAKERLERLGSRLGAMNENLASSPNAFALSVGDVVEAEEAVSAGISLASGEAVYTANCSSCHGARGGGDGPLSAGLQPEPAKHADGGYMNALSNDHIYKVIAEGGAAVGKSSMMAPWGTSLSDDEINSLVVFIRTLADPPYSGPVPGES